jgi:hypothetical protein
MNVICPYCGSKQTFAGSNNICSNCGNEVSRKYLDNVRKRPPVWMVTVGNTRHGKTTYVDSLTVSVENLGKISPRTFSTYLDNTTFEKIRAIRREAQEGILPEPTVIDRPRPLLMSLPNFLDHDSNTLVIYDLAGEIFDRPDEIEKWADAIKHAETIWFLISLSDLEKDKEGRSIGDLVQIYVDGMANLGAKLKGRRVLVVFTKGDVLAQRLPPTIRKYLAEDPYSKLAQMSMAEAKSRPFDEYAYLRELHTISDELRAYTYDHVSGGPNLINMIEYYGMDLSFTIVASIPGADGQTVGTNSPRFRVIDPLIWSLSSSQGDREETTIALILDASQSSSAVFADDLPGTFFDCLQSNNADVNSYYLGRREPIVNLSQRPEKSPRRSSLPMIGPILDQLSPNAYALAVVNGPIHDLVDYQYSSWHDRLFIVTLTDQAQDWPHKVNLADGETDPCEIANDFFRFMTEKK